MFGRDKIAKTVDEVSKYVKLVDHIDALQQGQKEIAAALNAINDRLATMEAEFKVLKADTQRDALREVQQAVIAVQGAFYDKLGALSTKVAIIEHEGQLGGTPRPLSISDKRASAGE